MRNKKIKPVQARPLSPKERAFCVFYTDLDGDCFGKSVAAAAKAKLSKNCSTRLMRRGDIHKEILRCFDERMSSSLLSPSKVLTDLEFTRLKALDKGDLMAAARCSELQGKTMAMFADRFAISASMPTTPDLSPNDRQYLAELSRLHLASGSPALIEASFDADSQQIKPETTTEKPIFQKPQDFIE